MASQASAITHAEPGRRIGYDGPFDELGSLATSLNSMLVRLEEAYEDQRRFVADASHELRTPVAVIHGNVELLRAGSLNASQSSESLEMIQHETERMARLIDDLLALARLEGASMRLQPLEVRSLVNEVVVRGRSLDDRNISCDARCSAWTLGDPDLLDRALLNLVGNAVAHTAPGGHIEVVCTEQPDTVTISITDDGPGIPPGDLERIFDRFYRAPGIARAHRGGGAGLGLAITRRLVELHAGTLSAHNIEPHGASFVITLPRIAEPDDPSVA
jgi:signal transduction histidine kinase